MSEVHSVLFHHAEDVLYYAITNVKSTDIKGQKISGQLDTQINNQTRNLRYFNEPKNVKIACFSVKM
uniref:Uncharacterized protein n=1 Tax=Romanomermis culicivorax TaxID=13658 RepID=A0A915HJL9_ROMCU